MTKHSAPLVFAIFGGIFGLIGAVMWATCTETCAGVSSALGSLIEYGRENSELLTLYMWGYIILGGGGAIVGLIGGVQAYAFKKSGLVLSLIALAMEVADLVLEIKHMGGFSGGFSFILCFSTILSIVMFLLASIFSAKKQQ